MARGTVLAVVAVCALRGCGTVSNSSGGCCSADGRMEVYGGVRQEATAVVGFAQKIGEAEHSGRVGCNLALALYVLAVDMPLSAVADTLTLPWTIRAELTRGLKTAEAPTCSRKPAVHGIEGVSPASSADRITYESLHWTGPAVRHLEAQYPCSQPGK